MTKDELKLLRKLVSDLEWDRDRLSSSGKLTLKAITKLLSKLGE